MELVDLKGRGDLESLVDNEGKFSWMKDVKGFLRYTGHRDKLAPSSGHMSVWMEQMQLPEQVRALTAE